jgi:hypothetical protein
MENRGDLFTEQAPNFCDIQPELCNIMDSLVAKVQETEYAASRITAVQQPDIRMMRTRSNQQQQQPRRSVQQPQQRYNTAPKPKLSCEYCYATGKEEKVWATHTAQTCFQLFPDKRRSRVRMITIPVETDEDNGFTLEDALDSLTDSYQNMSIQLEDNLEAQ